MTGFDWRRPPTIVHVEAQPLGASLDGETPVQWVVGGSVAEQAEDAERLAKGLLCANCLEPFPAPPSAATAPFFREVWADKPSQWRDRAMRLVIQECCPICACPISDSMHELFHEGREPGLPDIPERER